MKFQRMPCNYTVSLGRGEGGGVGGRGGGWEVEEGGGSDGVGGRGLGIAWRSDSVGLVQARLDR